MKEKEINAGYEIIGNSLNQIAARANATGFFLAEKYKENTEKLFCTILEIERVICLPEKIDLNIRTQKKKER